MRGGGDDAGGRGLCGGEGIMRGGGDYAGGRGLCGGEGIMPARNVCNSNFVRNFCTQFVRCFSGFVQVYVRYCKRPLFLMSNYWEPDITCSLIFKKWHIFCRATICRFIFPPARNPPPHPVKGVVLVVAGGGGAFARPTAADANPSGLPAPTRTDGRTGRPTDDRGAQKDVRGDAPAGVDPTLPLARAASACVRTRPISRLRTYRHRDKWFLLIAGTWNGRWQITRVPLPALQTFPGTPVPMGLALTAQVAECSDVDTDPCTAVGAVEVVGNDLFLALEQVVPWGCRGVFCGFLFHFGRLWCCVFFFTRALHCALVFSTASWRSADVVLCRVVLCVVVSCRVVSCRVVSCRVVSCRVVSCRVVSCRVVSCHVVSCRVKSCQVVSCRVVSCRVVSRHVASCCVVSCRVVSCRVASCRVVSCRVVSCRVVSCRVASCRVVSCRVVSCRVVSCRVVSCRVVSCRVVSCLVVSCRVASRRVVSCRVVSCRVVSCLVVSCRVASRRVVSCRVVSCRVVSRRVVSCRVVSCRVVSRRVVSCRVVSCRVVSCRVVSRRVVSCRVVSCRVVSRHVASCCVASCHVGSWSSSCRTTSHRCTVPLPLRPCSVARPSLLRRRGCSSQSSISIRGRWWAAAAWAASSRIPPSWPSRPTPPPRACSWGSSAGSGPASSTSSAARP